MGKVKARKRRLRRLSLKWSFFLYAAVAVLAALAAIMLLTAICSELQNGLYHRWETRYGAQYRIPAQLVVDGEVVGEYRPDALVWSDTLGLWQTHAALDIAAPLGTAVSACADGTVTEAYRDPLLGYTVRVEHADGYESLYACLQSAEMVEVGRTVQMGDVIGAVGESADAEADLGAHLHFAFFLDGEAMQPPLEGA